MMHQCVDDFFILYLLEKSKIIIIFFFYLILFISTWHHNITNEWKSFLSLLSERREMRASENAILSLGVGSNPGPLAPESCVLPCTIMTETFLFILWKLSSSLTFVSSNIWVDLHTSIHLEVKLYLQHSVGNILTLMFRKWLFFIDKCLLVIFSNHLQIFCCILAYLRCQSLIEIVQFNRVPINNDFFS